MTNYKKNKIIGIVGGMGPHSGLDLFRNVLCNTKATIDQHHLSVILISFPDIVDRTSYLEGTIDINPAISIVEIIKKIENAGAEIIGIACNTSHSPEIYNVILKELKKVNSNVKILNMPFETCQYIRNKFPDVKRIGLMTTNGTYRSEIYKKQLEDLGYYVVLPDFNFQNNIIHKMIYDPNFGIKSKSKKVSKEVKSLMNESLLFFEKKKSELIILGCTELSLALNKRKAGNMYIVDSNECLAKALVREAIVQ